MPLDSSLSLATRPRTVADQSAFEQWELSLEEANWIALSNCQFVRSGAQFLSLNNPLYTNPEAVPSLFDSAIQDSGFLFGQRGRQAALADFDTQLALGTIWGRNEQVQNNRFLSGGLLPGETLVEETAVFSSGLRKNLRSGGQIALIHDWNYNLSNRTDLLFPSVFDGSLRAELRQPVLAGRGFTVTGVAGPASSSLQGVSGVSQGVMIAEISTNISVIDFELQVSRMLREMDSLYWQLHLAYLTYERASEDFRQVDQILKNIETRVQARAAGGGAAEEAEVRNLTYQITIQRNNALDTIYSTEAQLRRLMGLPVDGSRLIRPNNHPSEAQLVGRTLRPR